MEDAVGIGDGVNWFSGNRRWDHMKEGEVENGDRGVRSPGREGGGWRLWGGVVEEVREEEEDKGENGSDSEKCESSKWPSSRRQRVEIEMQRLVVLLLVFSLLAHEATAVAAQGQGCSRRCGDLVVPYPFGFSGSSCPIMLSCNVDAGNSTAALILQGNDATSTDQSYSYTVASFNSTASTFTVSVPPSCNRTVSDAKRWLSGANYGVSSQTGLFLRGCRNATSTNCTVPAEVILRMENCGGGGGNETASTVTCIAAISAETDMAKGVGLFARWDMVEEPRCDNLPTTVYGETKEQLFSLELAAAVMRWWVDGECTGAGVDAAGRCAANATCHDVQTPSGAWGHQCSCKYGMAGDGFAAGDGCYSTTSK
ncbi:hypothetical protein OsI_16950 [Oryza sativa Indica Group]|uniref:Wall-associated receptor kinase galacturonan-binding domain-containing protein n=1 Tax=Oryza sativa subsp. indica TaxID=39946 RepID=B8ASW2_ORYSI|nr:hypothetical protein OsI_16950 [Oryza sativa Indica Group]